LETKYFTKKKQGTRASKLIITPQKITIPKSAPRIPAAAIGPGVGGTREWLADTPGLKLL
jgi:hypothetical protein